MKWGPREGLGFSSTWEVWKELERSLPALTPALPHRCEVSPCYKPEKSGLPPQKSPDLLAQATPDLCSLLCLPIMTFSGALP